MTSTAAAQLLPVDAPLFAPVTRRVLRRVGLWWGGVWALGAALITAGDPLSQAVGAGLVVPGGGFAVHGHGWATALVAVALSSAALGVSLFVWWMVGAVVLPVAVWALLVVVPLFHDHAHAGGWTSTTAVLAALGPVAVVAFSAVHLARHRRHLRVAGEINRSLAAVTFETTPLPSSPEPPVGEASEEDLSRLRFALDLALQPAGSFEGFDRRDQFREAALRYQLCILGYALATYRYTTAPAFSGYVADAHAASIEAMGDRRVWGYWPLENRWGRLRSGRDPVDNTDNVMLTGWQGVSVGMFETLEDDRFSRPGALTYRWSESETYDHDFGALASSIESNIHRSAFSLFSCEPRWIYPVCNTFGANTLLMHDRLHGTEYFSSVRDALGRAYREEFHRPDGRMVGLRSETFGASWNAWAGESVQMPTAYWMHSFMPDLAHRSWWMIRERSLRFDGWRYVLPRSLANRCDAGNYTFGGEAFGQTFLAMVAREMGDEDVAQRAMQYVEASGDSLRSGGAARYSHLSTQGNLYSLMARFGRHAGSRDLVAHGLPESWRQGPKLAAAAYPDVLVARAATDGSALDLVLRPGEGPVRAVLALSRLVPDRLYRVDGGTVGTVRADVRGCADIEVDIDGRTGVRVTPTW